MQLALLEIRPDMHRSRTHRAADGSRGFQVRRQCLGGLLIYAGAQRIGRRTRGIRGGQASCLALLEPDRTFARLLVLVLLVILLAAAPVLTVFAVAVVAVVG